MSCAGEKFLRRKIVYHGRILDLFVDQVRLANGQPGMREVVGHMPAVGIVPLVDAEHVILVRQYRYAIGRWLWEIPAGLREGGETPQKAAKRELREETGYVAKHWQSLGNFFSSPGFCQEELCIFLARDLSLQGELELDADECLEPKVFTWRSLARLLKNGELVDAKTVLALNLAAQVLRRTFF